MITLKNDLIQTNSNNDLIIDIFIPQNIHLYINRFIFLSQFNLLSN